MGNTNTGATTRNAGFTLVELIVVIVLLGILSMSAFSRMPSSNAFAAEEVVRTVIGQARLAQQAALSRANASVQLRVRRAGADVEVDVQSTSGGSTDVIGNQRVSTGGYAVSVQAGASSVTLADGDSVVLDLNALADVTSATLAGSAADPSGGIQLAVSSSPVRTLCVAVTGYAHRGGCL